MVLAKISQIPKLDQSEIVYSRGWDESTDKKKGLFDTAFTSNADWKSAILQGPHIYPATPIFKQPNESMKNNLDWHEIDLGHLPANFIPDTAYKISSATSTPNCNPEFGRYTADGQVRYAQNYYRIAWRRRLDPATERTLQAAIIPKQVLHVDPLGALHFEDISRTALLAALFASLPYDFLVKSTGATDLRQAQLDVIPYPDDFRGIDQLLIHRILRLSCLTTAYGELWSQLWNESWTTDKWAVDSGLASQPPLASKSNWSPETPLREDAWRRLVMVEIDALVSIIMGIDADELCTLYRTQFPVLQNYERVDLYDKFGHKIPNEINKLFRQHGEALNEEQRTWTHPQSDVTYVFEYPFVSFDREADMRAAHAHFTKLMEETD